MTTAAPVQVQDTNESQELHLISPKSGILLHGEGDMVAYLNIIQKIMAIIHYDIIWN